LKASGGLNLRGVNVTIPHKVAVVQLLDKLDPLAERIGAVNTIVNDEGILTVIIPMPPVFYRRCTTGMLNRQRKKCCCWARAARRVPSGTF